MLDSIYGIPEIRRSTPFLCPLPLEDITFFFLVFPKFEDLSYAEAAKTQEPRGRIYHKFDHYERHQKFKDDES